MARAAKSLRDFSAQHSGSGKAISHIMLDNRAPNRFRSFATHGRQGAPR